LIFTKIKKKIRQIGQNINQLKKKEKNPTKKKELQASASLNALHKALA